MKWRGRNGEMFIRPTDPVINRTRYESRTGAYGRLDKYVSAGARRRSAATARLACFSNRVASIEEF
jgi:hypothetical protein